MYKFNKNKSNLDTDATDSSDISGTDIDPSSQEPVMRRFVPQGSTDDTGSLGSGGTSFEPRGEQSTLDKTKKCYSIPSWNVILLSFFVFIIMAITYSWTRSCFVVVDGHSMNPTLHNGQVMQVDRNINAQKLSYGTIVTVERPKSLIEPHSYLIVKRIIGVPNDRITIKNNKLYLNGQAQHEDFLKNKPNYKNLSDYYPKYYHQNGDNPYYTHTLGSQEYFVMGDNRNNSEDSREIGAVKYNQIKSVNPKPAKSSSLQLLGYDKLAVTFMMFLIPTMLVFKFFSFLFMSNHK